MDDLVLGNMWKGKIETVKRCLSARAREKSENGDLERKSRDCDTNDVTDFMCQNVEERTTPSKSQDAAPSRLQFYRHSRSLSAVSLLGKVQVERLQHVDLVMDSAKEFGSLSSH